MKALKSKSLCFIIMPTNQCNLSCDYCFARENNKKIESHKLNLLFIKIKEICEKLETSSLGFYWAGREVLTLGVNWLEEMYNTCNKVFNEGSSVKYTIKHCLQSNILLYNNKWKDIIHKIFNGNIGTSLDYPNIYRKERGEHPDDFLNIWLKKRNELLNDGVNVGVISLPNIKTLEVGAEEFYDFYINKIEMKNFQVNIPFTFEFHTNIYTLDIKKYTKFMIDLFEIWWERGYKNHIGINPFSFFIDMINKPEKNLPCLWSPQCGSGYFSINSEGNISLCDTIVTNYPELHFGNIFTDTADDIINNKNRINFIKRLDKILDSECNDCAFCSICFGGCVARAYQMTHNIYSKDSYCETYKELFKKIELYTRDSRENLSC